MRRDDGVDPTRNRQRKQEEDKNAAALKEQELEKATAEEPRVKPDEGQPPLRENFEKHTQAPRTETSRSSGGGAHKDDDTDGEDAKKIKKKVIIDL